MNPREAKQIANSLNMRCRRDWSDERMTLFATDLLASAIGPLPFDVVSNTLRRLVAEVDPDEITLAKLIEAVKTRPAVPDQPRLEGPVVMGESPTERGLRRADRLGIPRPPRNEANRALLADMLVQCMGFTCNRCRRSGRRRPAFVHATLHGRRLASRGRA
jgi:hypothetical protein